MKIALLKNYLLVGAILCLGMVKAQVLSGHVTDEEDLPLPGVNIVVKGTTNVTQTDFDGNFTLSNVPVGSTLIFSYVGMLTQELIFDGETTINVTLGEDTTHVIEEVVVTGLGHKSNPDDAPQFRPWPPPLPSARIEIPRSVFSSSKYLGDVNDILSGALSENGYDDKAYFLVPARAKNGFAIATQLEQIDKDGVPKKDPNRWNSEMIDNDFSFSEYIKALLFPNPGYFRVIVFIVTDFPFKPTKKKVNKRTAMSWLDEGAIGFPEKLNNVRFNAEYKVIALVYEYELNENEAVAILKKPSRHTGKDHLIKSQIWNALVKE